MPIVPTFEAGTTTVGSSRIRATPTDTGMDRAGETLVTIGEQLQAARDRNDLVNAQLDFEEGMLDINKQFADDTGFGDIRERRADAVKELVDRVTDGLSDRAREEATPLFRDMQLKDEASFDATATKSEAGYRIALFEEKKNTLLNSFIYAESDEEKETALDKIDAGMDSLAPFMNPDTMAKFREGTMADAKYLRASVRIPGMVRAGEKFNPKKFKELDPGQVIKLQNQYNQERNRIDAENRAYFQDRIADHNAILMGTGQDDGLADEMARRGAYDLAKETRDNDKINKTVYDAVSRGSAEATSGSIAEKYSKAREKLSFGVGDKMAAEKSKALQALDRAAAAEVADFMKDPAAYVTEQFPPAEGEPMPQYAARITEQQRRAAGDKYFPARVLTKAQAGQFKARMSGAIQSGNTEDVIGMLYEISDFGPKYQHQVLSELDAPGALHVAMDSDEGTAMNIAQLAAVAKAKDIDPEYVPLDNVNEIMSTDYMEMLDARMQYDQNPSLIDYRNSLVDLAHKWIASGKDVEDLFDQYNVVVTDNVNAEITPGVDTGVFQDRVESYLESFDFTPFVSDGNAYKQDIIEKLKSQSIVVNASDSEPRLQYGQRGFYVLNPMTSTILRDQLSGEPLLITEDQVLGGV